VLKALRRHLTYANVMATIAVFVALGGGAYAAITITGRDVKNGSLTGKDIKRNSLGPRQIAELKLAPVRRAYNAARLGGRSPARYLVRCPAGTIPLTSVCIETQPRPAATYSGAVTECDQVNRPRTPGRRLPTHFELKAALTYQPLQLAPGGELTSNVYPPTSPGGPLQVMTVIDNTGGVAMVPNSITDGQRQFRCAVNPIN
jgi:hypothetical protein